MKSTRYLKYAVGEIFLVMIGILLALGINNWNNTRLQKIQANGYLKSLVEDLKHDTTEYHLALFVYRNDIRNNSQPFLNSNYQQLPMDSLYKFVDQYYYINRLRDQTYQKIKNSGLYDLLGSKKINEAVHNYYSTTVPHFDAYLDYDIQWTNVEGGFWVNNADYETHAYQPIASSLPFKKSEATRKRDLVNLIESTSGRNKLRNSISRKELGIQITERSLKHATELIEWVELELSK